MGWLIKDVSCTLMCRLQRAVRKGVSEVGEPALEGCSVMNGLEIKVACATSKVSYVLGTEDVFVRRRRGGGKWAAQRGSTREKRNKRFFVKEEKLWVLGMEKSPYTSSSEAFSSGDEDMDADKEN
jgi:hypothetical protein